MCHEITSFVGRHRSLLFLTLLPSLSCVSCTLLCSISYPVVFVTDNLSLFFTAGAYCCRSPGRPMCSHGACVGCISYFVPRYEARALHTWYIPATSKYIILRSTRYVLGASSFLGISCVNSVMHTCEYHRFMAGQPGCGCVMSWPSEIQLTLPLRSLTPKL